MKPSIKMPFSSWSPDTAPFYAAGENTAQNCMPYLAAPNYAQANSVSLSAIGQANAGAYQANATDNAGTAYMVRGAALTGATATKTGAMSFWVRVNSLPAISARILTIKCTSGSVLAGLDVQLTSTGAIKINCTNSSGTLILGFSSTATLNAGTTWYNILANWDLNTATANCYINNVSGISVVTNTNDTIDYTGANAGVFCIFTGSSISNIGLSELWFSTAGFDFTVSGNRAKFISGGFPVSLGSTGQTPTGTSPIIYLANSAGTFYTNSGTGGNFAVTGSLSIASSNPSQSTTSSQFLGAASLIDSNDVPHTYAGTSTQLIEITSVTANNLSKAGGYTALNWEFAGFTSAGTNNVYATDYTDNIQVMAVGGTVFADLGGSPPKAKHMAQVGQFLMIGNTNGGTINSISQGAVQNRVQWPAIGNPASWLDPLTNAGVAAQAGFQDLNLAYGAVQHISTGQLYGLVYQEHAITNFYYIGGNVVFQVNTYEKQRGCYCVNGVVTVGGTDYFIDQSGFFVTDGATVEPIGHDLVDKTWLADVNTAYLSNVRGSHDAQNKCIWWAYPSLTATLLGGFVVCDKVIVYNYVDKRWAMGMVGQSIDILFSSYALAYTMEQLDSVNSNLDLITPSLDSPYWNGGQPAVGVFGIAQIGSSGVYASYSGSMTGAALTATIDTKEVNLNQGGLALITAVNPVVMGATLANVQVAPITRNTLSDTPVVGTLVSPSTRTGKVPMRSNARYHRARVQISGGFTNAMGVEPEATPVGYA